MNTDLFQSSGHSPVLQIWLHIFVIVFITASSPSFISSIGIPSSPGALLSFSCLIAHSTSASIIVGSFSNSSSSFMFSFTTRLSSLYSSSVYSLHLSFIPSSSPIIFPSFVLSEPILGAAVFVIFFIFANISFVLPFFPSSSNSLHISFRWFSLSSLAFFRKVLFSTFTLSLFPVFFASLLSVATLIASSDSHGVVFLANFFGTYFSAASCSISFTLVHIMFTSSSSIASSLSLRSQTYSLFLFYILVLFLCNRIWSIYLLSAACSSSISMLLLIVHGLFRNLLLVLFLHLLSYFSIFYSPACSQSDSCVFHPVSSMYTIFFLVVRTTYSLFLTHLKRRTLPVFPQLHFVRPVHICRVLHSFPYCLLPLLR